MSEDIVGQPLFPERLHPGSSREIVQIEYVDGEVVKMSEPCTREQAQQAMEFAVKTGLFGSRIKWAIIRPLVP